jgi:hypothetical protein
MMMMMTIIMDRQMTVAYFVILSVATDRSHEKLTARFLLLKHFTH